jgi:hypothetical protein
VPAHGHIAAQHADQDGSGADDEQHAVKRRRRYARDWDTKIGRVSLRSF